ncbi:MAG TPA: PH domain-containing protein [Bryobacteraceae bacterium]|nr:PH domain-containing protein [Bryobacteraceae bacterium]
MHEAAKEILLRLLRVPADPKPPEGTPESIRVFRAGRNYYRWRLVVWGTLQLPIGLALASTLLIPTLREPPPELVMTMFRVMQAGAVGLFTLSLPITFFKQRLDYEMRWYIVTDRSLRVRSGIWSVQELTMTFANIQDIRVSAGPLQRLLGLADVKVTSAGGGGDSEHLSTSHMAEFSGVDCAEAIRDLVVERLRRYRDAGLGDPDDRHKTEAAGDAVAAARRVLEEARALRATLS